MSKSRPVVFALGCAIFLSMPGKAPAATLNFTEPGLVNFIGSTSINLSNATLTSLGDDFFIGPYGAYGETNGLGVVCGIFQNACRADFRIDFSSNVTNLSFESFDYQRGDTVSVSAYLDNGFLGSLKVLSLAYLDLSSFGVIDSLVFDYVDGNGLAFGDFQFEAVSVEAVPLPAALPLFAAGLGAISLLSWRRKRTTGV